MSSEQDMSISLTTGAARRLAARRIRLAIAPGAVLGAAGRFLVRLLPLAIVLLVILAFGNCSPTGRALPCRRRRRSGPAAAN
jgi:hypothetical protein